MHILYWHCIPIIWHFMSRPVAIITKPKVLIIMINVDTCYCHASHFCGFVLCFKKKNVVFAVFFSWFLCCVSYSARERSLGCEECGSKERGIDGSFMPVNAEEYPGEWYKYSAGRHKVQKGMEPNLYPDVCKHDTEQNRKLLKVKIDIK